MEYLTMISKLAFHPTLPHNLLSGSTDSLINIFDANLADEDEVLISITNHGSSIHHAGFLSSDTFFGLSHDESFSLYPFDPGERINEETGGSDHLAFGDLREVMNCEYVVHVLNSGDGGSTIVAAGSHRSVTLSLQILRAAQSRLLTIPRYSRHCLELVPLNIKPGVSTDFDKENTIRLEGAHGEEIVRSFCFGDDIAGTVFTAGEDGCVKAWRVPSEIGQAEKSARGLKKKFKISERGADEDEDFNTKSTSEKGSSARFKPY